MEDEERVVYNYGHAGTARPESVPKSKRRWDDAGDSREKDVNKYHNVNPNVRKRAPPPPRISEARDYNDRRHDGSHYYSRSHDYKRSKTDSSHYNRDSFSRAEESENRSSWNSSSRYDDRVGRYRSSSSGRPDDSNSDTRKTRESSNRLEPDTIHRNSRDSSSRPKDNKYHSNRGTSSKPEDIEQRNTRESLPRDSGIPKPAVPTTSKSFSVPKPSRPLSPTIAVLSPEPKEPVVQEVIEISDSSDESTHADKADSDITELSEKEHKCAVPPQTSTVLPASNSSKQQDASNSSKQQESSPEVNSRRNSDETLSSAAKPPSRHSSGGSHSSAAKPPSRHSSGGSHSSAAKPLSRQSSVESRVCATKPPSADTNLKKPSITNNKQFSNTMKKVLQSVLRDCKEKGSKLNAASKTSSLISQVEKPSEEKNNASISSLRRLEVKPPATSPKYSNAAELLNVLTGDDDVSSEECVIPAAEKLVASKPEQSNNPKPCDTTNKPKPSDTINKPKPSDTTNKPKHSDTTNKPKFSDTTNKPKPSDTTNRPKPSDTANKPKPSDTTNKPKPFDRTNKAKASDTTTIPKPSDTTNKPKPSDTINKPKPSDTTNKPKPSDTINKPNPSDTTNKPKLPDTGNKPKPSDTINKLKPSDTTNKPKPSDTTNQPKPSDTTNQPKPSNSNNKPIPAVEVSAGLSIPSEQATAVDHEDLISLSSGEVETVSATMSPVSDVFLECDESEPPTKKTKTTLEESMHLEKTDIVSQAYISNNKSISDKSSSDEIPELSDAPLEKITNELSVKRPMGIKVNLNLGQVKNKDQTHNIGETSVNNYIFADKPVPSEPYVDTPRTSPELSGGSPKLSSNGLPSPDTNDVSLYSDAIAEKVVPGSALSKNGMSSNSENEFTSENVEYTTGDQTTQQRATADPGVLEETVQQTTESPADKTAKVLSEIGKINDVNPSVDLVSRTVGEANHSEEESGLVVVPEVSENPGVLHSFIPCPSKNVSDIVAAGLVTKSTSTTSVSSNEGVDSSSNTTDIPPQPTPALPAEVAISALNNTETENTKDTSDKNQNGAQIIPANLDARVIPDSSAPNELTVQEGENQKQVSSNQHEIGNQPSQSCRRDHNDGDYSNTTGQEDNYPVLSIAEDPSTPITQFELVSDEEDENRVRLSIRKDLFNSDEPSLNGVDGVTQSPPVCTREEELQKLHIKKVTTNVQSKFLVQFRKQLEKVQTEVDKMANESLETFEDFQENLDRLLRVSEDQYRLIDGMKSKLFLLHNPAFRRKPKELPNPNSLDPLKVLTIDSLSEYFSSLLFIDSIQTNYKISSAAALNFLRHRICRILHYYCKQRPGREEGAVLASVDLLYHSFYKEFPGRDPEWTQSHIVRAWDSVRFFPGELDERAIKYDHEKVGSQGFLKKAKVMVEKVKKEIAIEASKIPKNLQILRDVMTPQGPVPGSSSSIIPVSSIGTETGRSNGFSPITPPGSSVSPGNLQHRGPAGIQQPCQVTSAATGVATTNQNMMQSGYIVQSADQYRVNLRTPALPQEPQMWTNQSHSTVLSHDCQNPPLYAGQSSSRQQPLLQSQPLHYGQSARSGASQAPQQHYVNTGNPVVHQSMNQSYQLTNPALTAQTPRPLPLNTTGRRHIAPAVQTSREQLREVHAQVSQTQRQGNALPQRMPSQTVNILRQRPQQPRIVMQYPPALGRGQHRMPLQVRQPSQTIQQGLIQQRTNTNQHQQMANFTPASSASQHLLPVYASSNHSTLQNQSGQHRPAAVLHQPVQRSNSYPSVSYSNATPVENVQSPSIVNISYTAQGGQKVSFNLPVNNQQLPVQNVSSGVLLSQDMPSISHSSVPVVHQNLAGSVHPSGHPSSQNVQGSS